MRGQRTPRACSCAVTCPWACACARERIPGTHALVQCVQCSCGVAPAASPRMYQLAGCIEAPQPVRPHIRTASARAPYRTLSLNQLDVTTNRSRYSAGALSRLAASTSRAAAVAMNAAATGKGCCARFCALEETQPGGQTYGRHQRPRAPLASRTPQKAPPEQESVPFFCLAEATIRMRAG